MHPGKGEGGGLQESPAPYKHSNLVISSQSKAFVIGHEQARAQGIISQQPGAYLGVTPAATQQVRCIPGSRTCSHRAGPHRRWFGFESLHSYQPACQVISEAA